METKMYKNWWILAANGVISILFGLLLVVFPEAVLKTIVMWFGAFILLCGVLLVGLAIRNIRRDRGALMIILEAVITIAIGLIILLEPAGSLKLFLRLVGIWALIIGIVQLVMLINITKSGFSNKNIFLFTALLTLALGIVLLFVPITVASVLAIILGIVACLLGILMIWFSIRLRGAKVITEKEPEPLIK